MSSIDFFCPICYHEQNKTISQEIFEIVEEYFYLGDKFRVSIFSPDAKHPQFWAMQNRQDRYRSWSNIAIKIISYFTLILPLIGLLAKVLLRHYLQISSIQVQQGFVNGSRMGARIPVEVLGNIRSFLGYPDQGQLAQVAFFLRDVVDDASQYCRDSVSSLTTEIQTLPAGPLPNKDFERFLFELLSSPAAGHPKYWDPVMKALMGHFVFQETIPEMIQNHADIGHLLARFTKPISSNQIYKFCTYLSRKQLSKLKPWVGYRALEQYLLKPELKLSINKAQKDYLTEQAKIHIKTQDSYCFSDNRILKFQQTDIDPRIWFGLNGQNSSLWKSPGDQNDQRTAPMPELLLEVLWTHIQSLRNSCALVGKPFNVCIIGRAEAQLPYNFILTLAKRIINAGIFLEYNKNTIDTQQIEKSDYTCSLGSLSKKKLNELIQRYPGMI